MPIHKKTDLIWEYSWGEQSDPVTQRLEFNKKGLWLEGHIIPWDDIKSAHLRIFGKGFHKIL